MKINSLEQEIDELNDIWTLFREMSLEGITRYSDIDIRNLFVKLSLLQSQAEYLISFAEQNRDRAKLNLELKEAALVSEANGPMNKRMAEAHANTEYAHCKNVLADAEDAIIIAKASARAATIAAGALSREISARLKN